ncbi:ATP-binding protein [Gloeocapsa sp. PCC 73106]|uniref:ATP-binding protein n=1 Tax=Gloeocapsa sp. PCC 73106 TaxID=102232 RepID=UPI0002ABA16D|nr:ATP-binding protein [Gloeocapsa sp. PCC 73106]ELR98089.1 NB-ARC domain-containing protein,Caspase domain-containing protein [Gloeocapsa sp. PCC 73106]
MINPDETHALIVGIETYNADDWENLDGPANDALKFARWLLERGVNSENIHLFVSPLEKNSNLFNEITSVRPQLANKENITSCINSQLIHGNDVAGELLYVFWSGHGIITPDNTMRRLLFGDISDTNYKNLNFFSLQEALKTSNNANGFAKQVFLIDTCAELAYNDHINITKFEKDGSNFGSQSVNERKEQFVLFAAEEYLTANNQIGICSFFSQAVMNELNKLPNACLLPDMVELTRLVEQNLVTEGKQRPVYKRYWNGNEEYIFPTPSPHDFFAYDASWVGRDKLIDELNQKLHNSCRFLLILGLTGIGKTALAERLVIELNDLIQNDWDKKLLRANFDYEEKSTDFASCAGRWLESLGEQLSPAEKNPALLLNRLVSRLKDKPFLVLIDSMERLLTENDDGSWGDFSDEYWEKFFLRLLSTKSCKSKLIVTSQDLPVTLHSKASRYNNFYQRHILYGLEESEQEALFRKQGLNISHESEDRSILLRLGKAYKGHPLVLRVIIGEINGEPFKKNVQAYWNEVNSKIEEVEKNLAEAEAGETERYDEWELHKLTRKVRDEVNKERLQVVFTRLENQVRDAYILICAASVYRIPVQEEGWLMQLAALVSRAEKQVCSKERQEQALEELLNRFLAEESVNHNNKRVLGQHNLVRSVALESHRKLIQDLKGSGEAA